MRPAWARASTRVRAAIERAVELPPKCRKAADFNVREETTMRYDGPSGGIYFMAFIGAAVYFVQQATSFWTGVVGILKAIAWPAFLLYNLLGYFKV